MNEYWTSLTTVPQDDACMENITPKRCKPFVEINFWYSFPKLGLPKMWNKNKYIVSYFTFVFDFRGGGLLFLVLLSGFTFGVLLFHFWV